MPMLIIEHQLSL